MSIKITAIPVSEQTKKALTVPAGVTLGKRIEPGKVSKDFQQKLDTLTLNLIGEQSKKDYEESVKHATEVGEKLNRISEEKALGKLSESDSFSRDPSIFLVLVGVVVMLFACAAAWVGGLS